MRDEPLAPALYERALAVLRLAARRGVAPHPEVAAALAVLARALPALRAQDWRHHGAEPVEGQQGQ